MEPGDRALSDRYPRVASYLAALPDGLRSYPECASKASLLRSALEGHDLSAEGALPAEIVELIRDVPPVSVWVPAVAVNVVFHAVCDLYYPSEAAVIEWSRARTRRMAKNPLYRGVLRLGGPRALIRIATKLDRMFQRGTHITSDIGRGAATIRLTHPPHLVSALNQRANIGMFEAMVEITGGAEPRCEVTGAGPEGATFSITWRE